MRFSKQVRLAGVSSIAALLIALGNGLPIHGHAHDAGHAPHVGLSDHQHGFGLVQYDLRVQPVPPPVYVVTGVEFAQIPIAPPSRIESRTTRSDRRLQSRAPPASRPRAPPH